MKRSRVEALIHLLGDQDSQIAKSAWEHLEREGEPLRPVIEEAVVSSPDPRVRVQARKFLLEWSRRDIFQRWVEFCDGAVELERGATLIAQSEYPEIDTSELHVFITGCAQYVQRRIQRCRTTEAAANRLVQHLHGDLGFTGNTADYYDPENSYLNRVIERKTGIPISLATVYLLVSRRLSLPIHGVGLPQHFLLKYWTRAGERLLDPFHGGRKLSVRECSCLLERCGIAFHERYLRAVTDREILSRTLGNLLRVYHAQGDQRRLNRVTAMLRLLEE